MSTIKLKIQGQVIQLIDKPAIYSGDINVDTVSFDFSSDWIGFTKTAVFFKTADDPYQQILSGDDDCYIPHEVVDVEGKIHLGVFGVKDDKVITTEVITYEIGQGILKIGTPSQPSDELWQQVLSIVQGLRDDVKKYYEELKAISANFMSVEDVDKICGGEYDPTYDDYNVFPLSTSEILEVLK